MNARVKRTYFWPDDPPEPVLEDYGGVDSYAYRSALKSWYKQTKADPEWDYRAIRSAFAANGAVVPLLAKTSGWAQERLALVGATAQTPTQYKELAKDLGIPVRFTANEFGTAGAVGEPSWPRDRHAPMGLPASIEFVVPATGGRSLASTGPEVVKNLAQGRITKGPTSADWNEFGLETAKMHRQKPQPPPPAASSRIVSTAPPPIFPPPLPRRRLR